MHIQQIPKFWSSWHVNSHSSIYFIHASSLLYNCKALLLFYIQSVLTVGTQKTITQGSQENAFFPVQIVRKSCVQVSITWMLNSECLCNLSATITDCVAFLVTAVADSFLHPFVESLLLQYSGCGSHFKGLFCFSWANLCLIFLVIQHCNRKKQLPLRKISDID